MENRKLFLIIGGIILVIGICAAAVGAFIFWAISNPQIQGAVKQLSSTLGGLNDLQQEIVKVYPADGVQVGITNGHILTISIANSEANKLAKNAQIAKAREIANYARTHYDGIEKVDTIVVSFVQQNGAFGISMSYSNTYQFYTEDLP